MMPMPATFFQSAGRFVINEQFSLGITGATNRTLVSAASRFMTRLEVLTGLSLPDSARVGPAGGQATLQLRAGKQGALDLRMEEGYQLNISKQQITLSAPTQVGIVRGLESLLQLLSAGPQGYYFPCYQVQDSPRYVWRGLRLDVAQQWLPIEQLQKVLDQMATFKLNTLHLVISGDAAFRVESKTYPLLHQQAKDGHYYTQQQVASLVAYAHARGIRVVPGIPMPEQTGSWLQAYPELGQQHKARPKKNKGKKSYALLSPANEASYRFVKRLIFELAPLFTDRHWDIGGTPESNRYWAKAPQVKAYMAQQGYDSIQDLEHYFYSRMVTSLLSRDKRMAGSPHIARPGIPPNFVSMAFTPGNHLLRACANGYRAVALWPYQLGQGIADSTFYARQPQLKATAGQNLQNSLLGAEIVVPPALLKQQQLPGSAWYTIALIAERLWSPQRISQYQQARTRLATNLRQIEMYQ